MDILLGFIAENTTPLAILVGFSIVAYVGHTMAGSRTPSVPVTHYRGIDMTQLPEGSVAQKIEWLLKQSPTTGLRIRDSAEANRVLLAWDKIQREQH